MDSNLARDLDKRRSTTSYAFMFARATISWASRLQHSIALSFTEDEWLFPKVLRR